MNANCVITLRKATPEDLPALISIEHACFHSDRLSSRQMRYHVLRDKRVMLVAEIDQQVVGYGLIFLYTHRKAARLYALAVLPEWHNKGIGNQLISALLQSAKQNGQTSCRLEVRHKNQAALHAYLRLGFKKVAELPNYYNDGEDGIRMALPLN